jgi:hypothetical protein
MRGTNTRYRETTAFGALCNPAFHLGVSDKLAGLPLREGVPRRGELLYEGGRLFTAFCQSIGEPVPALPRRGHSRAAFAAALSLLERAMDEGVFPQPPPRNPEIERLIATHGPLSPPPGFDPDLWAALLESMGGPTAKKADIGSKP